MMFFDTGKTKSKGGVIKYYTVDPDLLLFRIIARIKYSGIYFDLHKGLGLLGNAIADLLGIT